VKTEPTFSKETEIRKREVTNIIAVCFTGDVETSYTNIKKNHLDQGLLEIGFHYIIEWDGKIFMGRHANQIGNLIPELNSKTLYLCVIGEQDDMEMEQSISYQMLMEKLSNDFPSCQEIRYFDLEGCY
jgi:hypothetical protein